VNASTIVVVVVVVVVVVHVDSGWMVVVVVVLLASVIWVIAVPQRNVETSKREGEDDAPRLDKKKDDSYSLFHPAHFFLFVLCWRGFVVVLAVDFVADLVVLVDSGGRSSAEQQSL